MHRDASMYQPIPEDTWVLCFGWYMHALFRLRHGFPLHRNLRPIFVSFHCNKRGLLTPAAIEYLRRHGPVGCRDWTTVYLLLSCGVPAFFSGCVTTTIDTVFPALAAPPPADAPRRLRRHARRRRARRRGHLRALERRGPAALVRRERRSRARAAGDIPQPPQRGRHVAAALLPAGPVARRADASSGRRTAPTSASTGCSTSPTTRSARSAPACSTGSSRSTRAILAGRPEAEVYALWRELTAADVRRRGAPAAPAAAPARRRRHGRAASSARSRGRHPRHAVADAAVHCAVVLPKGGGARAARAGRRRSRARLAAAAPLAPRAPRHRRGRAAARRALPAAQLQPRAGARARAATSGWRSRTCSRPSTASCCCRWLRGRAGDVAELAELDLGGHAWAAPLRPGTARSGFGVIHAAAARLGDRDRCRGRAAPHRARAPPLRLRRLLRRRAGARPRAACGASGFSSRALPLALAVRPARRRGPALPRRARSRDDPGALGGRVQRPARAAELRRRSSSQRRRSPRPSWRQ